MFSILHALAKQATLMITVAAEGDEQLRVNVTPMPFDTKAKANLPKPLSLLASPAEFDTDFAAALTTWHAPKRSLIEQAQAAAGAPAAAPAAAPALPAPKSEAKNEKSSRKSRGKAGAGEDPAPAQANGETSGDAVAAADQVAADSVPATANEQLPAGGVDAGDAHSEGTQQAEAGAAPAAAQVADAAPVAPAPAVDQEPVDKFTLDLF